MIDGAGTLIVFAQPAFVEEESAFPCLWAGYQIAFKPLSKPVCAATLSLHQPSSHHRHRVPDTASAQVQRAQNVNAQKAATHHYTRSYSMTASVQTASSADYLSWLWCIKSSSKRMVTLGSGWNVQIQNKTVGTFVRTLQASATLPRREETKEME